MRRESAFARFTTSRTFSPLCARSAEQHARRQPGTSAIRRTEILLQGFQTGHDVRGVIGLHLGTRHGRGGVSGCIGLNGNITPASAQAEVTPEACSAWLPFVLLNLGDEGGRSNGQGPRPRHSAHPPGASVTIHTNMHGRREIDNFYPSHSSFVLTLRRARRRCEGRGWEYGLRSSTHVP